MGTNGGLTTYHIHGSDFSSPGYAEQMNKKNAQLADQELAMREVLHFLVQGLAYFVLTVTVCSFGFITGLEFITYPLLMRKLTCKKDWDIVYESVLPTSTLFANMIGSIVGGIAVDKLGRRPVFIVSALLGIVAELVNMISMETTLYIVSRGLSSLIMGVLYNTTLLYSIESVPAKHRLHSYLLHRLAQDVATTIIPLVIIQSPLDGTTNTWPAISTTAIVILALGLVVGIFYPEPAQSSKIRASSNFQNKFSVMQLDNDDDIQPEPRFARYTDMFYKGGKVSGTLLILLFFVGGLLTTSVYLSFPVLHNVGSACPNSTYFPKPCMQSQESTSSSQMMNVFGCSILGSVLGYISVQRYGRKNSYRAPAALRVVAVISMVMCASHNFMLSQAGFFVLFTGIMDFTLDLYSMEVYAVRSRATSFGLLRGLKLFGIAVSFLINPYVLLYVVTDLKFLVITIVSTLMFGCSLGLRKDTFVMALNIEQATIDVGL